MTGEHTLGAVDLDALEKGRDALRYVLNFAEQRTQVRSVMNAITLPDRLTTRECLEALWSDLPVLIAELRALREADWQPIETAPRDGTHILVTEAYRGGLGYCGPLNEHGFRDPADWCDVVHWFDDPEEPGFYSTSWGGDQEHPFGNLTHWKPLPVAPARAIARDPLERCGRCGARHIEHDQPPLFVCPDREGTFFKSAALNATGASDSLGSRKEEQGSSVAESAASLAPQADCSAAQRDLENLDTSTWGVDVRIAGVNVLTIESGCLSGIPNISDYQRVVWNCAEHLRAFIGDPDREPEPCFACGGSGQERLLGSSGDEVIPCSLCSPQANTAEGNAPRDEPIASRKEVGREAE